MKKSLKDYINHANYINETCVNEVQGSKIDSWWLDNEKPVQTKDRRPAVVLDINISKVPNIIKGKVKNGDKMSDYEWNDDGTCIKATDELGNPQKPSENDNLVKGI